jgi:hypothetical protein
MLKNYRFNVLPKRNKLGHVVIKPHEPPYAATSSGDKVNLEEMRILRKEMLQSRAEIRNLLDAIQKV